MAPYMLEVHRMTRCRDMAILSFQSGRQHAILDLIQPEIAPVD